MKEIKLIRLELRSFKGMTYTFEPDGQDADVLGANASGKSTLSDGWHWLLFDKDSLGRADFEIKPLDAEGHSEDNVECSVEGVCAVNGTITTLKKVHREKWEKKRGAARPVFTGNTTDYFVNGVPTKMKDYAATIEELVGSEEIVKLLTSPTAFPSLHWTKARGILMEACGDVTDAQVIDSMATLGNKDDIAILTAIIKHRSLDDHRAIAKSDIAKINDELKKIPVRIDEVKKGLPDVTGLDREQLYGNIVQLETSKEEANLRLSGIDNGAGIAELSKELKEVSFEIGQLENKYYLEGMRHVTRLNSQINELAAGKETEERTVRGIKDEILTKQARITSLETELEGLREKWAEIDAEEFQDSTDTTCPACGQALPSERVEDARTKALAHHNRDKAERLLKIETKGKELRAELDRTKERLEELHQKLTDRPNVGEDALADLITERDALKAKAEDYSQIPGRAEMLEQKAGIERRIQAARDGLSQDKDVIQKEIDDLTAQLKEVKEKADRFVRREQGENRIEELKGQEKVLNVQFERLERELFVIEQFIKAKASINTDRINGLFDVVSFRLFNVLVNGGVDPCCEITVKGVPYNGGLNSAARTNGGLDVCRTLSRHYGLSVPVFVDNAESVCELIKMDAQVIRLVVSEPDKTLRVETGKKRMAA